MIRTRKVSTRARTYCSIYVRVLHVCAYTSRFLCNHHQQQLPSRIALVSRQRNAEGEAGRGCSDARFSAPAINSCCCSRVPIPETNHRLAKFTISTTRDHRFEASACSLAAHSGLWPKATHRLSWLTAAGRHRTIVLGKAINSNSPFLCFTDEQWRRRPPMFSLAR